MTWIKVGVVVAQFLLALAALFSDDVKKPLKHWLIAGMFIAVLLSIYDIYFESEKAAASSTTGTLTPKRTFSEFKGWKYVYNPNAPLQLRMGNSNTVLVLDMERWLGNEGDLQTTGPETPRAIIGNPDDPICVRMWLKDGYPQLGLKLYNKRGALVAEIDGNRWFVKRELLYDLNFDSEAIEVRDEEGDIQLQIVFYENMIQLSMVNYRAGLGGTYWGASEKGPNGGGYMGPVLENGKSPVKIPPLFKYPSVEFRGERL